MKLPTHCLLAVLVLASSSAATAQRAEFPERNITVIVPFPPGGASDITARLVTSKLSRAPQADDHHRQPCRRQRDAGCGCAQAGAGRRLYAAGGFDRCVCDQRRAVQEPALRSAEGFRTPVAGRAYAERVGGNSHLSRQQRPGANRTSQEEFQERSRSRLQATARRTISPLRCSGRGPPPPESHVPYKGGGPAINDLVAGHANVSFQNLGSISQHVKAGRLKALAVTSEGRVSTLPEVPSSAEAGVKDLVVYSWQAAAGPKGLPASVKAKLEAEFVASANSPDVRAKFEGIGFDVVASNSEQFAKFLAGEIARWKSVVEGGKIAVD